MSGRCQRNEIARFSYYNSSQVGQLFVLLHKLKERKKLNRFLNNIKAGDDMRMENLIIIQAVGCITLLKKFIFIIKLKLFFFFKKVIIILLIKISNWNVERMWFFTKLSRTSQYFPPFLTSCPLRRCCCCQGASSFIPISRIIAIKQDFSYFFLFKAIHFSIHKHIIHPWTLYKRVLSFFIH